MFTNLLAHADSEGYVDIHPRAISEEIGLPIEQVRAALLMLESEDEESRTPDEKGRRILRLDEHRAWGWQIVNYIKYRKIKNSDDRREQNREAQQRYRDKQRKQESAQSAHAEEEAYAEVEKEKKTRKRASFPSKPDDVSEQIWQDWIQLRKGKRAAVTQTVLSHARAEADKAGMPLGGFLAVWCARGSQGLEAAWLKPEERGQRGSGETAYQRTMRERVEQITPRIAAKAPGSQTNVFDMEVPDVISGCLGHRP